MVRLFMTIALTVLVGTLVMVDGWHQGGSGLRTATNHGMGNRRKNNANPHPPSTSGSRSPVALVSFLLGLSVLWTGTSNSYAQDWDLLNGSVTLPDPFRVSFRDRQTGVQRSMTFTHPQIIGAGGGGAVFSFDGSEILLKVSWPGTAKTVQRECQTLQLLEDAGVQASERCLATLNYDDQTTHQSMILVTPYMKDAVSSIDTVPTDEARRVAVDQIARTLVQMISANIITIDVQPLISKATGQTIFIDMTEAQVLSSTSYSFLDQTFISSFVSEMVALIPEAYWTTARISIIEELEQVSRQEGNHDVAVKLQTLLKEQTPFFMD